MEIVASKACLKSYLALPSDTVITVSLLFEFLGSGPWLQGVSHYVLYDVCFACTHCFNPPPPPPQTTKKLPMPICLISYQKQDVLVLNYNYPSTHRVHKTWTFLIITHNS